MATEKRQKAKEGLAHAHEKQLQQDRAMIATYRSAWKDYKGPGHVACTHVRDVLWWLQHICGINMLDNEEKVIVVFVFTAVLALILIGAYKQGAQLVHTLQQLAADKLR